MEALQYQFEKGCHCASCTKKSLESYEYFVRHQDKAENIFFEKMLENPILDTKHFQKRCYERGLNFKKALHMIEEGGLPISYQYNSMMMETTITVLTYDVIGSGTTAKYLPYHFVLSYSHKQKETSILTFYKPNHESYSWQWDDTYSIRVFDHQKKEEMDYAKSLGKNWAYI